MSIGFADSGSDLLFVAVKSTRSFRRVRSSTWSRQPSITAAMSVSGTATHLVAALGGPRGSHTYLSSIQLRYTGGQLQIVYRHRHRIHELYVLAPLNPPPPPSPDVRAS